MTSSTGRIKILPSPILPERAVSMMVSAIDFGVAFLAAETFDFAHGHAGDADFGECFTYIVEFEGFDDGFDFFHGAKRLVSNAQAA